MFRGFLLFYGLVFIVLGVGGFIPGAVENNLLWDTFKINILLNITHLCAGILAWIVFFLKKNMIKIYYRTAGVFFFLLALLGLAYNLAPILQIFPSNPVNSWFHMIMGFIGIFIGFAINSNYKGFSNERNQRHKKK